MSEQDRTVEDRFAEARCEYVEPEVPVGGPVGHGRASQQAAKKAETNRTTSEPQKADRIVGLAAEAGIEIFRDEKGDLFADIQVKGHWETRKVGSREFRDWLTLQYFQRTNTGVRGSVLDTVEDTLRALALVKGVRRRTWVRVASSVGRIFFDLCDDEWRMIEIMPDGWEQIDLPSLPEDVRFRRAHGMKALPLPRRGGSVELLHDFLNLKHQQDFVLVVSWLVGALRGRSGYPVLVVTGEQGTAKSTFCRFMRRLIDPNAAPLRGLPRGEEELHIAANNGHVLAFDNVSHISASLSDALCVLATGGGFATRKRYSDDEEAIFDASRPIILNGITDIVGRPDLADRSIFIELAPIPDEKRLSAELLEQKFDAVLPDILGALLDICAHGLGRIDNVHLEAAPRMADFTRWGVACEGTLPRSDVTFMQAYQANRARVVETVLEADAVASALLRLMSDRREWQGTATDLKRVLDGFLEDGERRSRDWPGNPQALSRRLRRLTTPLRKIGIEVQTGNRAPDKTGTRLIELYRSSPLSCE